jgi:peptide/nickel transport system permease protein
MWQYIVRRILIMIPVLIGISILIFGLMSLMPGDYITGKLANPTMTQEKLDALRHAFGLDQPTWQRYFAWAWNMLQGDFGESFKHFKPVLSVIGDFIWNSFIVALLSMILSWLIGGTVGILSAKFKYSLFDKIVTVLVFLMMALPTFFLAITLMYVSSVKLGWTPVSGMTSGVPNQTMWEYIKDVAYHLILPVSILTMVSTGGLTRYFRTSMLDVINMEYIRTARAKGLKESTVIFKHALRNALLPAITIFGSEIPGLFGGAMILEKVLVWPGIGKVYLDAINDRNVPLVVGFLMIIAVITLFSYLLTDVLYGMADPRVRLK